MADPLTESQKQLKARGVPLTRAGELGKSINKGLGAFGNMNPTLAAPAVLEKILESVRGEGGVAPTSVLEYLLSPSKELQGLGSLANRDGKDGVASKLSKINLADLPGTGVGVPNIENDTGLSSKPYPAHLSNAKAKEQAKRMFLANRSSPSNYIAPDREPSSPEEIQALIDNASKTKEDARSKRAEDFRAKEEALVENFGGGDQTVSSKDAQKATENAFNAAMSDFLNVAKGTMPEGKERTLEDYKREFAEATGVDVSGKVDKSSALMAMGLALMQNKAGKGFNVANALSAVGEAGEKALPALEKAKSQAKSAQLAAGKYSLTARNTDRAKDAANVEKARSRSSFYVVPKGEGVSGFLANIDKGSLENFNSFELDALMSNKAFSEQFDIVPGSTWSGIVTEAMKTKEAEALYLTKSPNMISLIPGVEDDLLTIKTFDADPNKNPGGRAVLSGDGQEQYEALARMAADNERARQKFIELGVLTSENRNFFTYGVDKINSLGAAFGIKFSENETETDKIIRVLEEIAMKKAPEILGESGKTISDGDRERVQKIVGELRSTSDIRTQRARISQLFNDIILGTDRKITGALTVLDRYTNRSIGGSVNRTEMSEEDRAERIEGLKALGINVEQRDG